MAPNAPGAFDRLEARDQADQRVVAGLPSSSVPLFRSGGQAQYVDAPVPQGRGDAMSGLLAWGSRSSGRDSTWTISGTACSGQPARRLLESTDDPIETVALRAGYDDEHGDAGAVLPPPADLAAWLPAHLPGLTSRLKAPF